MKFFKIIVITLMFMFVLGKKDIRPLRIKLIDSVTNKPVSDVTALYFIRTYRFYGKISALIPFPDIIKIKKEKFLKSDENGEIIIKDDFFWGFFNENISDENIIINFKINDMKINNPKKYAKILNNAYDKGVILGIPDDFSNIIENYDSYWIKNYNFKIGNVNDYKNTAINGKIKIVRNGLSFDKKIEEIIIK